MILSAIQIIILTSFDLSQAQDFQYGKIVGVSEGRTCKSLPDPEHGYFKCHTTTKGHKECVLKCDEGYVEPITYTPPDNRLMDVGKRGTYRCTKVTGGLSWVPDILYDCVQKVVPKHFLLHFRLTFHTPCPNASRWRRTESQRITQGMSFMLTVCEDTAKAKCSVQVFLACQNDNVVGDLELSIPLSVRVIDNFPGIRSNLESAILLEPSFRRMGNQRGVMFAASTSSFFSDCPRGTRLESDVTCRGCSKGYYLDLSRSVCARCPKGTYQDQDHRASCKACPEHARRDQDGLQDISLCFFSGNWRKFTSVKTIMRALACIAVLGAVVIYYRGTVTYEPGPDTVEKDILDTKPTPAPAQISWEKRLVDLGQASGDHVSTATNRPARKLEEEEQRVLGLSTIPMPLEPPPRSANARRSLARDRLQLTLDANLLRHSATLRRSYAVAHAARLAAEGRPLPHQGLTSRKQGGDDLTSPAVPGTDDQPSGRGFFARLGAGLSATRQRLQPRGETVGVSVQSATTADK